MSVESDDSSFSDFLSLPLPQQHENKRVIEQTIVITPTCFAAFWIIFLLLFFYLHTLFILGRSWLLCYNSFFTSLHCIFQCVILCLFDEQVVVLQILSRLCYTGVRTIQYQPWVDLMDWEKKEASAAMLTKHRYSKRVSNSPADETRSLYIR